MGNIENQSRRSRLAVEPRAASQAPVTCPCDRSCGWPRAVHLLRLPKVVFDEDRSAALNTRTRGPYVHAIGMSRLPRAVHEHRAGHANDGRLSQRPLGQARRSIASRRGPRIFDIRFTMDCQSLAKPPRTGSDWQSSIWAERFPGGHVSRPIRLDQDRPAVVLILPACSPTRPMLAIQCTVGWNGRREWMEWSAGMVSPGRGKVYDVALPGEGICVRTVHALARAATRAAHRSSAIDKHAKAGLDIAPIETTQLR